MITILYSSKSIFWPSDYQPIYYIDFNLTYMSYDLTMPNDLPTILSFNLFKFNMPATKI